MKIGQLAFLGFAGNGPEAALIEIARSHAQAVEVIHSMRSRKLTQCDVLVVAVGQKVDAGLLARTPRLRLIVVLGTDRSGVDERAAERRSVRVHSIPGYSTDSVAEFVFGALIDEERKLGEFRRYARLGRLREPPWSAPVLRGGRFGIIGLGAIGQRVARIASLGFGADVSYWSRTRRRNCEAELGVRYEPLDALLRESEIVTDHLALTPKTRGILSARRIGLLPGGATLVHTSPLGLIDLRAIERRLRIGDLTFIFDHADELPQATLDRFRKYPTCICYPPIACATRRAAEERRMRFAAVLQLARWSSLPSSSRPV